MELPTLPKGPHGGDTADWRNPMWNVDNRTPHDLTICAEDGTVLKVFPSTGNARVSQTPGSATVVTAPNVNLIIVGASTYGEVTGLPTLADMDPSTLYVVSLFTAQALRAQGDPRAELVVCPATGPADGAIRDGGKIVGVTRLVRV